MKEIICKELEFLEKISLYDSSIYEISIYKKNYTVDVRVCVKLSFPNNSYLKLIFEDVVDYTFSWAEDYDFYTIESYKLLKFEDGFYYCSFDPADRESVISKNDGAVIKSKEIKAYYSLDLEFIDSKNLGFG